MIQSREGWKRHSASQPPKDKLRVEGILMVTRQPDQEVSHSRSEHWQWLETVTLPPPLTESCLPRTDPVSLEEVQETTPQTSFSQVRNPPHTHPCFKWQDVKGHCHPSQCSLNTLVYLQLIWRFYSSVCFVYKRNVTHTSLIFQGCVNFPQSFYKPRGNVCLRL